MTEGNRTVSFSEVVRQRIAQVLSLPERTIRSLATIAVGASTLLTDTLFPKALRGTTTYKVTIGGKAAARG